MTVGMWFVEGRFAGLALVGCLASISGCAAPDDDEQLAPVIVASVEDAFSLDEPDAAALDHLIERTRRAFAMRGDALLGGDATVGTRVSSRGIEVRPFAWPDARKTHREQASIAGRALTLATSTVARGARDVGLSPGVLAVASDGSGEIRRGPVVERIRNVPGGSEQSWELAAPPPGRGDLSIEVEVTGQNFAGETASGLHFVDPATGLGFRYGHGVWIDARGTRTPVPAVFEAGRIVLRVADTTLDASAFPAVLDPIVSAEYGFDNPLIGPAVGVQNTPDVVYGGMPGMEYLAVWSDARRETDFFYDVRAARINASGVVVDPVGLHVPSGINIGRDQVDPAVAWTDAVGTTPAHWLVVWTDHSQALSQIRGIKLQTDWSSSPSLGPDFDISERTDLFAETQADVTAAPGSTGVFAVTFRSNQGRVWVRRFEKDSPSGSLVGAELQVAAVATAGSPSIASSDSATGANAFFVAWEDTGVGNGNIYGRTVPASGTTLGTTLPLCTATSRQSEPAIAYAGSGNGWVTVWSDERNGPYDVYGRKITNDGTAMNGADFLVSSSSPGVAASGNQSRPSIAGASDAANGNTWFVSWQDDRAGIVDIYGSRVRFQSGAMSVLDSSGIVVAAAPAAQSQPSFTYNPQQTQYFGVWTDGRSSSSSSDIYGARVSAQGSVVDPAGLLVSTSANQQDSPAMAACGGKYLVAWSDTRNGVDAPDIYGVITDNATPPNILVPAFAISTAAGRQTLPDVACNTNHFFVVWADERNGHRDIYGARVQVSNGAVLEPGGIHIAGNSATETEPAIAYQGWASTFQVVWSDNRNGHYDIYGKRISTAGVVDHLSEVSISGNLAGQQIKPDIAPDNNWNATTTVRFFVVWQDGRSGGEFPNWDIYGRYLNLNSTMLAQIPIATSASAELSPSVATRPATSVSSVRGQLVAFEREALDGSADIVTASIGPTSNTVTGTLQLTVVGDEREPRVTHRTGGSLVVAYRSAATGERFDYNVLGQEIAFSPLAVSGSAFAVAAAASVRERSPAIACASGVGCQVALRRYIESPQSGQVPQPTELLGVDRLRGVKLDF